MSFPESPAKDIHAASATSVDEAGASLEDLASRTSDYLKAWSALVVDETRLARLSLIRLGFAALVVPALALAICVTANALVVATIEHWLHDWALSIAITLFLDLVGISVLVFAMRRWWRNLSLPRSRAALARAMEKWS